MGRNRVITDEKPAAKIFNDYFILIIKYLHIEGNEFDPKHVQLSNNPVLPAVNKFSKSPKYFENQIKPNFSSLSFRPVNYEEVLTELKSLDMSKITQLEGIPTKVVKENLNVLLYF